MIEAPECPYKKQGSLIKKTLLTGIGIILLVLIIGIVFTNISSTAQAGILDKPIEWVKDTFGMNPVTIGSSENNIILNVEFEKNHRFNNRFDEIDNIKNNPYSVLDFSNSKSCIKEEWNINCGYKKIGITPEIWNYEYLIFTGTNEEKYQQIFDYVKKINFSIINNSNIGCVGYSQMFYLIAKKNNLKAYIVSVSNQNNPYRPHNNPYGGHEFNLIEYNEELIPIDTFRKDFFYAKNCLKENFSNLENKDCGWYFTPELIYTEKELYYV